ncbi:MAG: NADH-quinone oxidoreductase subunit NuoN [candidate division Zixibacteria bacterium]|nr:NADH-quinone oxidoreductase subunit NuoN [candidate division Zixibacteria bacterium]
MNLRFDIMIPELFLFGWAIVVLTADLFFIKEKKNALLYMSQFGFLAAAALVIFTPTGPNEVGFGYMFYNDTFASFFKIVILLAGFMAVSSSFEAVQKSIEHKGEFFGLVIMSAVGMMFLVSSTELVSLYVALELSTIPLFILTAFQKRYLKSSEAGLKYLILGALSSALLLYGMSFMYGMTGTTVLLAGSITMLLNSANVHYGLVLSLVLVVAGLGFKLALVPFHMWAPDVYEGAPTPITSYLSVASKAAGLAALTRIVYGFYTVGTAAEYWGILIAILAALAMIIGNFAALLQSNIKRMLAYSSIAQAGYILVGFVAASQLGLSGISIYIFAYLFANMGAFAIVVAVDHKLNSDRIEDYAGMARRSPLIAVCMTIFLLSLAGIPPTAGFIAKYKVFMAAIENGTLFWLVMIAVATTVVSIFYYARVIKEMFITEREVESSESKWILSSPITIAILVGLIGTLIIGIYPEPFLELASTVTQSFVY